MSRLPFELFLALRYLRPKRTFVSVITVISVIGVTLGVAVLIIVISVMSGFDKETRDRLLGFNAHMRIIRPGLRPMPEYREVMRFVSSNAHVKATAPYVIGQVMIETQDQTGNSLAAAPWLRGMDPQSETNASNLSTNIIGSADLDGSSLLVGSGLARELMLHIGDRIAVYSPNFLKEVRQRLEEKQRD